MLKFRMFIAGLALFTFLPLASLFALSSGFSVIATGDNFTEIEFELSEYELIPIEINGVVYHRLYHPESSFLMHEGLPETLSFSALISIPNRGTVSVDEPLIKQREVKSGITLFPSQGFEFEIDQQTGFILNEKFYTQDVDYPGIPYQVSTPAIMRDYRLITINVNPFSFNPARSELTINKKLTLRINYDFSTAGINEILTPPRRASRDFEKLFRSSVLNSDQFRNPSQRNDFQQRSIIVVHHHTADPQYVATLNNYLNWKRDKGFIVNAINTANYNTTTAINNYIVNAYETWDNPPEHVVMIGNTNGTISVPIWQMPHPETYTNPGVIVATDHLYTTVVGDDDLGDLFVGRINISSATQFATYWNKLRNYERTPFMANTDWYARQLLVGDPSTSGVSTIFTNRYVKEVMLRHNPNYSIVEVYQSPFPAQMQGAINQGVGFFNFRGMENIAGWQYPSDNHLYNGYMLNNMVMITCRTMLGSSTLQVDTQFAMGTPTSAKGIITGIGMSHVTRTAFNNSLSGGIFYGLYVDQQTTMGEALGRGKLNLWQAFFNSHWAAEGRRHIRMVNLYGDPSMDVWKGVPKNITVAHPPTLPQGSNSIEFVVTDDLEQPIEDAWVTIRRGTVIGDEEIFATGYTDENGRITHLFNGISPGVVTVTITKPDYKPHLGSFEITGNAAVTFERATFNGDINAGSQSNFIITAKNHRAQAVNGVNGSITTTSQHIEIITAASAFGNIAANGTAQSNDAFVINISPDTPSGHRALFTLTITDNAQNSWVSRFQVIVNNGRLIKTEMIIDDGGDGVLDPTEQATLLIRLKNVGDFNLENLYASLTGGGYGLNVLNDTTFYGNISVGQTTAGIAEHLIVFTTSYALPGMNYNLFLNVFNNDGFYQVIPVTIPIGTVTVDDPLGPDAYGYWCYDSGDIDYVEAPVYEWIEIVPDLGGNGFNTGVTANFNNTQGVHTMNLPFAFRFYGREYNDITISANGWVTFGPTQMSTQRNWLLPGPLGPSPIIAAFWDNLSLAQGGVYTWYDQENNKFIIQWQNARNVLLNAEETFQIILYNPEFYLTTTNDGPIKIQYKVFNNVNNGANSPAGIGNWGNYATIGIADHTCKVGLQYTFNNRYPAAARPLGNRTALYFATGSLGVAPYVAIDSYSYVDDNNNIPEYGETGHFNMTLQNIGGQDAFNINAVLSTNDPYTTVIQNQSHFGDLVCEASRAINNAYTIQFADNTPSNHRVTFFLNVTADGPINWNFRFNLDVKAPDFVTFTPFVYDPLPDGNNNGLVDPGEILTLFLPIKNQGGADSPFVNMTITSQNNLVQITNISETTFDTIVAGLTMYPAISLVVNHTINVGTGIVFDYSLETGGYEFSGSFLLGIGGIIPAQIGTGDNITAVSAASPINIYFKTLRGQSIYTVQEVQNAGVTTGGTISSMGFFVASAPFYTLTNFRVRMRHTTATDGSAHIQGPYQGVYLNPAYAPTAGGWDMITLNPPFEWNGVDNILVDTAFAPVTNWSSTGQVRVYDVPNGYRFARSDNHDQTDVETTEISAAKPQIRMMIETSAGFTSNRPENLKAFFTNATTVRVEWSAPAEHNELLGYNIYRNGLILNGQPIVGIHYLDTEFDDITRNYYYVTAVYQSRETLPSNISSVDFEYVFHPVISPEQGNYYQAFAVTITTATVDADIYYTLNDTEPTLNDILYTEPIQITFHTKIRAISYKHGSKPSEESAAQYYVLNKPVNLTAQGSTNSVTLNWTAPPLPNNNMRSINLTRNQIIRNNERSSITRRSRAVVNASEYPLERDSGKIINNSLIGYNIFRAPATGNFTKINAQVIQQTTFVDSPLEEGKYRYYVTAVYLQGESHPSETVNAHVGETSAEEDFIVVYETELRNAYPNPFNPETTIEFTLKEREKVLIEIYDISGRKIKTLSNDEFEAGRHHLIWRGNDSKGRRTSSGIYFYKMTTSSYRQIKKVVLLK